MLHLNKRLLTILSAAAIGAAAVFAQHPKSPPPAAPQLDTGTTFRSDTRVVVLHTTVVDKSGHLVVDLPKEAFTVMENNVAQPIRSFKREDVPVSIGLVIDNSGSMRDKRARVEAAALAL